MANPIYQPKGKAREYSPYALNIYMRCDHHCRYCYVPAATFRKDYFSGNGQPRANLIKDLEKQLSKEKIEDQVLLSFIGDPYGHENLVHGMTGEVLQVLLAHKVPVAILSKGGKNCLTDLALFQAFSGHIKVGASLTFFSEEDSKKWEPGAASPMERFETLKELHGNEIKTWASLEPIIDPVQTLRIIEETHSYVDHYKVGKVNHMPEVEKAHDWDRFLSVAVRLLRKLEKRFYIKESLQKVNRSIVLTTEEVDQDFLNVT